MSPQPIGVAIAGLGFGEKVHLPAIAATPDLQAVALWHPRDERLGSATADHGLKGYSNWDDLLALSLIHISEPTRRRGISYAVFCLKKKK